MAISHFLLVFAAAVNAQAKSGPSCSFDALTQNCAVFSPKGPLKIPAHEDGTYVPNYSALDELMTAQGKLQEEIDAEMSQSEIRLGRILDGVTNSDMSMVFKYHAFVSPNLLFMMSQEPTAADKDERYYLYWPPESKSPRQQEVSRGEIYRRGQKALLASQREQIRAEFKEHGAPAKSVDKSRSENTDPLAIDPRSISKERLARVKQLFSDAQASAVVALVGGKAESTWTPAQAAAVAKVRSIVFVEANDERAKDSALCDGLISDASYVEINHSLQLCPTFYNFADATIVAVMGHEIAHAIDPANVGVPVYTLDVEKVQSLRENSDKSRAPLADLLLTVVDSGMKQTAVDLRRVVPDAKIVEAFVRDGYIKLATPPYPAGAPYLLNDVIGCLKSSLPAEGIADWLGARVLGDFVEKNPPRDNAQRLATVGFYASLICLVQQSRIEREANPEVSPILKVSDATRPRGEDYVVNKNRIDKIYLSEPRVAKALLCEPTKAGVCRHVAALGAK